MFRQTSTKQANAQTQARQPNKQLVKNARRLALPKQQKRVSVATPKATSIKKRLNIQPSSRDNLDSYSLS